MTTDIKMARPDNDTMIQIGHWLQVNVGPGSYRTIKNGFMGMDDWFYVLEDIVWDETNPKWENGEEPEDYYIFTFRRETDATVFALKWTTQTMN